MTVYVGVPMWPFKHWIMCHMFADTDEELNAMAKKIGLRPEWIQAPRDSIGPHYDISENMRRAAIKKGAVACDDIRSEVDAFELVRRNRAIQS